MKIKNMKLLTVVGLLTVLTSEGYAQVAGTNQSYPGGTDASPPNQQNSQMMHMMARNNMKASDKANDCKTKIDAVKNVSPEQKAEAENAEDYKLCKVLEKAAQNAGGFDLQQSNVIMSGDVVCQQNAGYVMDYKPCESAVNALNYVIAAETAMNLQQQVRTQIKNKNIQEQTTKAAAQGDLQTGVFDANIESNKHQKAMMQEKAVAYSAAVTALGNTYFRWPKEEDLLKKACEGSASDCSQIVEKTRGILIINDQAKKALIGKITEYIAKGAAAGIAMGQFNTAAKKMEAAKQSVSSEDTQDMMVERCQFNPNDPACLTAGNRVTGDIFKPGEFSFGEGTGNNAFNMGTPDTFGEEGEAPTVADETVASANSPFEDLKEKCTLDLSKADEATKAYCIMNPAAAASVQPGSPSAGGGGGVGGGGGGGSASLGSDLEGAEKDDKTADIKATKSSGNYNSVGGSGYAAVKGGKDANPFANLFDAKSSGNAITEDRSIASEDIDGKSSGLFQKISKRYNLIQAEKRLEANNLE